MEIYLLSFVVFALAFAGLAVGLVTGRGVIRGSCGGLNSRDGVEGDCEVCGRKGSGGSSHE